MVLLGFDKQCITPDLPIAMSGYAGERIATGVHDDLYTRCIVMVDRGETYLLVQCDCIAFDESIRQDILAELAKQNIYIEESHFILFATHTHSGPAGTLDTSKAPFQGVENVFGKPNPKYRKLLTDKIVLAVFNSFLDLATAFLTVSKGTVEGVGTERHDPSLPGDSSLLTLLFQREDGKKVLLYNYACHPTVLPPANLLLTADLPYGVERDLKDDYDMVMFVNGCCGDISTRFTRASSSFEQIDHYSKLMTSAIKKALASPTRAVPFTKITIQQYPITLPVKKLGTVEEETKLLEEYLAKLEQGKAQNLDAKELRILESYVEGAAVSVDLAKTLQGIETLDIHYSIIKLQHLTIAVIPGELFCTLGNLLKQQGIEVFCYGNGYYLYLADENAYDQQYYEAMTSPFAKGDGEQLIKAILES